MDDQFDERLVYSSESDEIELENNENNQDKSNTIVPDASPSSLDKEIDKLLTEVEQPSPSTIEDDEPIFSSKGKKSKKILSSDEDSDAATDRPEVRDETKKSIDGDSDEDAATARTESEERPPVAVRSTLWDSDTTSDDDRAKDEPVPKAKKKVLKKKKKKDNKKPTVEREGSGSDSSEASADEKRRKNSQGDGKSSQSSSDTDEAATINDDVPLPPREKIKQRMSAKAAADQIKEIQSESQRLARQIYIHVPYHKPKQHSLKEFLNRHSLTKQQELLNRMPTKKAAAAIKMSSEELQVYAESLEQRAQEAIEFFQNEDDESIHQPSSDESDDDKAKNESEPSEKPKEIVPPTVCHDAVESEIMDDDKPDSIELVDIAPIVAEISEIECVAVVAPIAEQPASSTEVQKELSAEPNSSNVALHTDKSKLDLELDKMISDENKRKKLLALSLSLDADAAPKLIGYENMMIDLDSNEVKPREKSGVEELQERFLRHAMKKPQADSQTSEMSIFNTEIGALETISHFNETVLKTDSKPGQSYYKLKNELGKKLSEKRREAMLKRIEEEKQKRLEMESDDDEEELEEYSDCGAEESEHDVVDDVETENEPTKEDKLNVSESEVGETLPGNEFIDSEAEDEENGSESNAESDDNENDAETEKPASKTKRSRIIAAFADDSGDEMPPPNGQTSMAAMETSSYSLGDSATDQSFGELPQTAITQMDETKRQEIIEDMKEFESRLLDTTTQVETSRPETTTSALFPDDGDDGEIGESQLMALCSGAFVTQQPPIANDEISSSAVPNVVDKVMDENVPSVDLKTALLSSDDEKTGEDDVQLKKLKKKSKKNRNKQLNYSDDEDEGGKNLPTDAESGEDDEEAEDEIEAENEDEELDLGERFVEYDSDENEVEVTVPRKELRKKASEFVEQEAELSESEWGSEDEDEKGMDVFDDDLVNDEEFDQRKLQSELERIRMRQQIDQDAREVRILKEMYIEDDEDIGQRERKFRWKNIDNTDPSMMQASADNDLPADNEEDENEEEWRRLRYEREQMLLKQTNPDGSADTLNTTSASECDQRGESATNIISSIFRRTSIVKTVNNSPNISSPFLINQSALMSAHVGRKSFLNRGEKTLEKLVNLTKTSGDGETIKSTATGKGNYVFTSTEKTFATKRKSDIEQTEGDNQSKKIKVNETKKKEKTKPSLGFFELLSK